jgi:hypothetical protein
MSRAGEGGHGGAHLDEDYLLAGGGAPRVGTGCDDPCRKGAAAPKAVWRILTTSNCCLETVGPVRGLLSEPALKNLKEFADFQAEYEGSIPFTRSNCDFNDLAGNFKLPFWRRSSNLDTRWLKADANSRGFLYST